MRNQALLFSRWFATKEKGGDATLSGPSTGRPIEQPTRAQGNVGNKFAGHAETRECEIMPRNRGEGSDL